VPGVVAIWAGYVAVPSWLQMPGPRWLVPLWLPAQVVLAGAMSLGIDGLLRHLQQPMMARQRAVPVSVPSRRAKRRRARRRSWLGRVARTGIQDSRSPQGGDRVSVPSRVSDTPEASGRKAESRRQNDQEEDIIMIELD
jgi:hypothetical protein